MKNPDVGGFAIDITSTCADVFCETTLTSALLHRPLFVISAFVGYNLDPSTLLPHDSPLAIIVALVACPQPRSLVNDREGQGDEEPVLLSNGRRPSLALH